MAYYFVTSSWEEGTFTAQIYNGYVEWPSEKEGEIAGFTFRKGNVKGMLYKDLKWVQKEMDFDGGKVNGKWRKKMTVPLTVL